MKYYGNHWTSQDGTELQCRFALDTLQLWARSCPRGGEWTDWRRLDVQRDLSGVLLEIVRTAQNADHARTADTASYADKSGHAEKAASASHADSAAYADKAQAADKATHAVNADHANTASAADTARRLAQALGIALTGVVTGSGYGDGTGVVTVNTIPGAELQELLDGFREIRASVEQLGGSMSGLNNSNGNLASRVASLEKKLGELGNVSCECGDLRQRVADLEMDMIYVKNMVGNNAPNN